MKITTSSHPVIASQLAFLVGAVVGRPLAPQSDIDAGLAFLAALSGSGVSWDGAYSAVDCAVSRLRLDRDTESPLALLASGCWRDLDDVLDSVPAPAE